MLRAQGFFLYKFGKGSFRVCLISGLLCSEITHTSILVGNEAMFTIICRDPSCIIWLNRSLTSFATYFLFLCLLA
jgi:hypothetical protein